MEKANRLSRIVEGMLAHRDRQETRAVPTEVVLFEPVPLENSDQLSRLGQSKGVEDRPEGVLEHGKRIG